MRGTRTILATALVAFGIAAAPAAGADYWLEPAGGPSPINASGDLGRGPFVSNISGFSMADLGGTPHLAWSEWDGKVFKAHVARLDGDEWKQVGADLNAVPARDASSPALAVNAGKLWVTWLEKDQYDTWVVHVARLDGSTWVKVGGVVDVYPANEHATPGQFSAGQAQLAFLDGVPYLGVLEDDYVEYQFNLMRLDGGQWVRAARGQIGNRGFFISRGFDLEVSGGRLYIDGGSYSGNGVVWRLATNGTEWENVGLPPDSEAVVGLTDVNGVLHTAYASYAGDGALVVARLVGGVWQQVGPDLPAAGGETGPHLGSGVVSVAGVPHLLIENWTSYDPIERELGVIRLSGDASGWEPVGAGSINHSRDVRGDLLAGVGATPYVAWAEFDGCNYELRVARTESASADDPPLPPAGPCPKLPPKQDPPDDPEPADPDTDGDTPPVVVPNPDPPLGACGTLLEGTLGGDSLTGGAGPDEISGLAGNDRIWGLGHADCLFGGTGNDTLDGGAGNDELHGESGNDRLKGGADSDELFGEAGNDRLTGGDDEDVLDGGAGNDTLTSGDGFDSVNAGAGNDVIDARGAGFDRIDCGPGRDRVKNATRRSDRLRGCERVSYVRR